MPYRFTYVGRPRIDISQVQFRGHRPITILGHGRAAEVPQSRRRIDEYRRVARVVYQTNQGGLHGGNRELLVGVRPIVKMAIQRWVRGPLTSEVADILQRFVHVAVDVIL